MNIFKMAMYGIVSGADYIVLASSGCHGWNHHDEDSRGSRQGWERLPTGTIGDGMEIPTATGVTHNQPQRLELG